MGACEWMAHPFSSVPTVTARNRRTLRMACLEACAGDRPPMRPGPARFLAPATGSPGAFAEVLVVSGARPRSWRIGRRGALDDAKPPRRFVGPAPAASGRGGTVLVLPGKA